MPPTAAALEEMGGVKRGECGGEGREGERKGEGG